MRHRNIIGYHGSSSSNLKKDDLSMDYLKPVPIGGSGLFIYNRFLPDIPKRYPFPYRIRAKGRVLDLTAKIDQNKYHEEEKRYYKERPLVSTYGRWGIIQIPENIMDEVTNREIEFHDKLAEKYNIDMIKLNWNTSIIKNLESVTSVEKLDNDDIHFLLLR